MIKNVPLLFLVILGFSCTRLQRNSINTRKHLTIEECLSDENLKIQFNQGYVDMVELLFLDVKQGAFGRDGVPGLRPSPLIGLSKKEYAKEKGMQFIYNRLTNYLIDGFIEHEKYLLSKGWKKPNTEKKTKE